MCHAAGVQQHPTLQCQDRDSYRQGQHVAVQQSANGRRASHLSMAWWETPH